MRHIFPVIFIFWIIGCSNPKEKDFSDIEKLDSVTDSLLTVLQEKHDQTSDNLYFVADDSVKRDSLIRNLNLLDSIGFYRYIEKSLNDVNEIVLQTQQEIFFAKDQLNSIKTEYENNDISKLEYLQEIKQLWELIEFLQERVDSNLHFIRTTYYFDTSSNDSLN